MSRQISIFILTVISWLSCNTIQQKERVSKKTENKSSIENIVFDFSAKKINSLKRAIEVSATLYNSSADTIYFLTTTCDGTEDRLQYDTTKFDLAPSMECNIVYLLIEKIAPNGQYKFNAHFRDKAQSSTIKLGFDFCKIDKEADLKKIDPNIFYHKQREKIIIWSNEKKISK